MDNFKLYNGDYLEIMKEIPDNSVDLVLTDPPYNTTMCDWDIAIDVPAFFREMRRISKRQILFGVEPFTSKIVIEGVDTFCEKITWKKHKAANFGNFRHRLLKYTEDIVVFGKGVFNPQYEKRISTRIKEAQKGNSKQWRTNRKDTQNVSFATDYGLSDWNKYDPNLKLLGNVFEIPSVVSNSKEKTSHPTQKPLKLIDLLLKIYSNENNVVLDPFMGSGTTGVACRNLNRKFIGIEIDKTYFGIAKNRIEDRFI